MENTKTNNKKLIKIVFVSDAIWPYNKGGKEKRLFDISTRLVLRGHDVHIYTMKWWEGPNIKKENGVTLHAICKLYPLYTGSKRSIKEGVMFGLACLRLITENWDVIEVDQIPFFPLFSLKLISLFKGKRMFATWHEVWGRKYWNEYLEKWGNMAYIIEKLSTIMPNKIISVSEHTTSKLRSDLSYKKEIITAPDGIDFNHIQGLEPSVTRSDIIFAGRLLPHKNVDVIIKSMAVLRESRPGIKCLIIGNGPEKIRLDEMVSSLGLAENVTLLGFIENQDEVLSLVKSSKVFVFPSVREGFGIVVIEAIACGIPVVTIDGKDNGSKDLIEEGKNGYICNPDEKEIANKVLDILEKEVDGTAKQVCRDSVRKYNWDEIVDEIEEVYKL